MDDFLFRGMQSLFADFVGAFFQSCLLAGDGTTPDVNDESRLLMYYFDLSCLVVTT